MDFNMKYNKILVTGGSGMVGKSLKKILPEAIYISSKDFNLITREGVEYMLIKHKPDVIIHLAARVGGILDNIKKPADYFFDNIMMNTLLIDMSYKIGVKRFIGILSTCIYPDTVDFYPMNEDMLHKGPPTTTNFSYGYAKRSMAVQIDAYNKQYGLNYQYLIPCNLYGEFDKYGENSHFIASLIKKIHLAKTNKETEINLLGTGKPLRQFMHSDDFAKAIKLCLDNEVYTNMNISIQENLSIKQMAEIALDACDAKNLKINFNPNYSDGQYRKDVSIEKLKETFPNFKPMDLYTGIKQTYKYIVENKII